jgi:hypothetical protein
MTNPQIVKDLVEISESALTGLGILAAGAWAYFNFFRGRTYTPRLRLRVNGDVLYGRKVRCILITTEVENLGLSKVTIDQIGTGIRILGHRDASELEEVEHIDTLPIFEEHEWIEPKEVIEGESLAEMPKGDWLALRLEMRIVSQGKSWTTSKTIPIQKESTDAMENAGGA